MKSLHLLEDLCMHRLSRLLISVLLSACNPFFLEARVAAVCHHASDQRLEVPPDVRARGEQAPVDAAQRLAVSRTFELAVAEKLPSSLQTLADTTLALTSVVVEATGSDEDLGFIDEAHLTITPPAGSGLPRRQFEYRRSEPQPRAVRWDGEAFDVAAYLEAGALRYEVTLVGSLPPRDLAVDVTACAEATLRVDDL